jgi:aminopeptidase N
MNPTKAGCLFRLALRSSALLLVLGIQGYATRHERFIDAWRPTNFNITIRLDDRLAEITKARTEITVEALKEKLTLVDLDFGEMAVDTVWIDGKAAQFDRTPGLLNVHLQNAANKGQRFVVSVEYHGKPKDGLILTNDKDGKPSATGDNWPDRVHHWIPCLDHPSAKATVRFTVTAPAKDLVVANGRLDQVTNDSPGTRTWAYTEAVPIPAYCMIIAVGDYAKSEPATSAVTPLTYYVPQSEAKKAMRGFAAAAPSLKFFSEAIARYPYEKLALIVGATRFGGMENSSAIVFAENFLGQRSGLPRLSRAFNINEALEEVVAHEIAHQWFGDSVTESTWSDLWLSEGFATYFAGLVVEKYDGADAFHAYMKRAAESYFLYEKKSRTPIHDTETEKLFDLLNENNYQKGAWVLHMLRSQLGDDAFFRGLRIYYYAHKDSTAKTDDLRAALEKTSGKDLKEFFARWVYGSGHPQYELSWGTAKYAGAGGSLMITLKQTQPDEAFLDPVPIEVTSYDYRSSDRGSAKRRLWIQPTSKVTTAQFRLNAREVPTNVQLDPDDTLLKEPVVSSIKQVKPVAP